MTSKLSRLRITGTLIALLIVAVSALAASKITVTGVINSADSFGNPYTLQGDASPSATYSAGAGVASELDPQTVSNGSMFYQWDLTLQQSSRSFVLTLKSLDGSTPPFLGPIAFNGALHSRCYTPSGSYQNWTLITPLTPDTNCAMRITFTYNGLGYVLVMSPEYAPGTGTATVTCTNWSTSSKSCVAWTDVSSNTGTNANIAQLSQGSTLIGSYFLSFNIELTHP